MGKKDAAASNKTLAVTLGSDGNIKYDAILHQGRNKDKIIASEHSAMVPKVDREVHSWSLWSAIGKVSAFSMAAD